MMATDHHMSERVYGALKTDVMAGVFPSGRLHLATLEDRYAASATPVREALLRLVGEGLLTMPATGGFATLRMNNRDVASLYEFGMQMSLAATRWPIRENGKRDTSNAGTAVRIISAEALFTCLAHNTQSSPFADLVAALNSRLQRVRAVEPLVLRKLEEEMANLADLLEKSDLPRLRRALSTYHRRRLRRAADIADKLEIGH